jgi:hypothetical protein
MSGYFDDESLILYQNESGRVYGFERESAALFLQIDEILAQSPDARLTTLFPSIPDTTLEGYRKLLLGDEEYGEESYEPPLNIGRWRADAKAREHFSTSEISFSIHYPNDKFRRLLRNLFSHLPSSDDAPKRINIDFIEKRDGLWQVMFNDRSIGRPSSAESVPLIVQENLIIAHYQAQPYLMAMHAGGIVRGDQTVIFPAESGSGKSTLTAAMLSEGFELLSDEIALLGYDGLLRPVPFALNIKEGSWNVLEKFYPKLMEGPRYLRFDGQYVRFLPPDNLTRKKRRVSSIIFPKYTKGKETTLAPITSCEALRRIRLAGYQLDRPLSRENFEKILANLLSAPAYTLEYESLHEAAETIKKVCGA